MGLLQFYISTRSKMFFHHPVPYHHLTDASLRDEMMLRSILVMHQRGPGREAGQAEHWLSSSIVTGNCIQSPVPPTSLFHSHGKIGATPAFFLFFCFFHFAVFSLSLGSLILPLCFQICQLLAMAGAVAATMGVAPLARAGSESQLIFYSLFSTE